jgi:hypothetical protein
MLYKYISSPPRDLFGRLHERVRRECWGKVCQQHVLPLLAARLSDTDEAHVELPSLDEFIRDEWFVGDPLRLRPLAVVLD